MHKIIIKSLTFLMILFICTKSSAESRYILCGPDEDGCFMDQVQYCACIPYNEIHALQPYCLDFDKMQCEPLSEKPACPERFIYKDQMRCLATIFQSEPEPPCSVTTYSFCVNNKAWMCDAVGNPRSCKK